MKGSGVSIATAGTLLGLCSPSQQNGLSARSTSISHSRSRHGSAELLRTMTVSNNMADTSSREREGEDDRKHIEQQHREKSLTPFERLTYDLAHDERYLKEITLGKRIGFYRIRGELGSGNFCQVKMGIHSLTRGKNAR